MQYLNLLTGALIDALMRPFSRPWPALAAAAAVTAVLMLLIVRATSSPAAIRRAKNRLTARVLELVLFRHDAAVSFTAGGRILAANFAYLGALTVPLAFSIVPCMLLLAQLASWFEFRPLRVGEPALLEVKLRDGAPVTERRVSLSGFEGVRVDTAALRVPALSEFDWRLRGDRPGPGWVEITVEGEAPLRKEIAVGDGFYKVSRRKTAGGVWETFLHPAEPPIDRTSSIERIEVRYPMRTLDLGGWEINWVVAFLVLAVGFGLVLRRPLGVQL